MEDQGDTDKISSFSRSGSKLMAKKRSIGELEEVNEVGRKRVKLRDLDSVLRFEGMTVHQSLKSKDASDEFRFEEDVSQVTDVPVTLDLDASQAEGSGREMLPIVVKPTHAPLDLNTQIRIGNSSVIDDTVACDEERDKPPPSLKKHDRDCDGKFGTSRGIGLDLNVEDVTSSVNQDPFYPYKNHNHVKPSDLSECGSTTGTKEEKDPLRVWKEMKQNGFLSSSHCSITMQSGLISSSHGGIPAPKQRGRKNKNDVLKKKMELAKREQVDRFTKIAAPSGLLNELNPGIINHVRNRKQVHSIIEALVRSEKHENSHVASKEASHYRSGTKEIGNKKDLKNMQDLGVQRVSLSLEEGTLTALSGSKQTRVYSLASGDGDSSLVDRACGRSSVSHSAAASEDDTLALKLSSSTRLSENGSSLSNEESANLSSVSSLSVKAATVASQWLELLHQDIKGRLSALRRSKKRVRAVITTELPFLISKEFSSNQENDPNVVANSDHELSNNATADMHRQRWSTLFDQMDQALSEEEKQLEIWLNQVKEMQLRCDQGLQHIHWNTGYDLQQLGTSEKDSRSENPDSSEHELAVRAAAASIYSTCNFLLSKENVSCC